MWHLQDRPTPHKERGRCLLRLTLQSKLPATSRGIGKHTWHTVERLGAKLLHCVHGIP